MNEKYKNLPNWISAVRIILIPPILYFVLVNDVYSAWVAVGLFFVAGVSDYFDGYFARKYKSESIIGKFLDPIADKLLVSACFIALLFLGKIGPIMLILLVLRDIFIDGLRCVAASHQMVIAAGKMGKWKTAIQMLCMPFLFFPIPDDYFFPGIMDLLSVILWFTVFLSLASAFEYTKGFLKKMEP